MYFMKWGTLILFRQYTYEYNYTDLLVLAYIGLVRVEGHFRSKLRRKIEDETAPAEIRIFSTWQKIGARRFAHSHSHYHSTCIILLVSRVSYIVVYLYLIDNRCKVNNNSRSRCSARRIGARKYSIRRHSARVLQNTRQARG